jgi:cytochrome c-type biogenesis protein CcmF
MFNFIGNLAEIINILSLLLSISCIIFYYKGTSDKKWIKLGNISYHSMTFGIILMSLALLLLIINHQYQYTYVFGNSSNELSFGYLLSSFYAGQEGSFLLWALFLAIIGVFLMYYSRKHNCDPQLMGTYAFILSFFLILIINKSPFDKLWETYPDAIRIGAIPKNMNVFMLSGNSWAIIPPDGSGLNPLLQNFWMQIHPPILFLGFTLMAVPFVFTISALIHRNYINWIKIAIPWILLSSSVLGLGIILGGFWAYETLGWGGYWGWDPVENSSLIPWLISIALVHTTYTQRKTNGLVKTNLFLSIISFLLIIYSTFLTRSGVLQDSSVHSFTQPGTIVYLLLLFFLLAFLLLGVGLFVLRLKDISSTKIEFTLLSRESFLTIGSILIIISSIIIFAGTSYPLISKSSVDISFYNKWNLPLAILITFFNALSLILKWKHNNLKEVLRKSFVYLILSVSFTIVGIFIGVKDLIYIFLIWGSLFALCINIEKILKVIKNKPLKTGSFLSHIGLSLLLIGIVGSARYDRTINIQLPLNESVSAFGQKFTYIGQESFENGKKTYFNVKVDRSDGDSYILKPLMFFNQMNNGVMKVPDIKGTIFKDLYFSPKGIESQDNKQNSKVIEFEKGQKQHIADYNISFLSYETSESATKQMRMGEEFSFIAKFLIEYKDGTTDTIYLKTNYNSQGYSPIPQITKDNLSELSLIKISVVPEISTKAQILFRDFSKQGKNINSEILIADISIKPLIAFLWIGSILIIFGLFIAIKKRIEELKL